MDHPDIATDLQARVDQLLDERRASRIRRVETLGELKQIVSAISVIAGTMKRLSINAAIESSRAGEAGTAFSVVAAEMKVLAIAAQTASAQAVALLDARDRDRNVG